MLLLFAFSIAFSAAFNIPIPFGNIDINETQFGIQSGLNIGGNGAESGMTVTSKNGSVQTQSGGGVLVGGQKFGTNSTLGVDKKQGLTANTDVQLGKNQTLHGGLGKENTFINDLTKLTENSKKNKPATRRGNGGQHK